MDKTGVEGALFPGSINNDLIYASIYLYEKC